MADQPFDPETGDLVEAPQLRPFSQWLIEQRGATLHNELTERLAEVAAACTEHEKPGSLTLTISLKPSESPGVLVVSDEIKTKVPEPSRGASLFHTDDEGNLTRENPRQTQMPLREVPRATQTGATQ